MVNNKIMINFHSHSIFSDGDLIPFELARRHEVQGYSGLVITDHADFSNIDDVVKALARVAGRISSSLDIKVIPGVELTHVSPEYIRELTVRARKKGARFVSVHGETLVEPVKEGTNRAAIEAGVDLLAHPGMLSDFDARLAAEKKITVEITSRKGHCYTNGHVMKQALKYSLDMVFSTDCHSPSDIISASMAKNIFLGSGGTAIAWDRLLEFSVKKLKKISGR